MNYIYDLTLDKATGMWYVQKIDIKMCRQLLNGRYKSNDAETLEFPSYNDAIKWIKADSKTDKITII